MHECSPIDLTFNIPMRVIGPLHDLIVMLATVQAVGVGYLSYRAMRRFWIGLLAGAFACALAYAISVLTLGDPIDP